MSELVATSERVADMIVRLAEENRSLRTDLRTAETTLNKMRGISGSVQYPDSPTRIFTAINKLSTALFKGGDVRSAVNGVVTNYKDEYRLYVEYMLVHMILSNRSRSGRSAFEWRDVEGMARRMDDGIVASRCTK